MKNKNIVFILRGLPGSGKSIVANKLAESSKSSIIHSTDDYHIKNNEYVFDGSRVKEYHRMNLEAFTTSCEQGTEIVVCDNTNVLRNHYKEYKEVAEKNNYIVIIIVVDEFRVKECKKREKHDIPLKILEDMKKQFQFKNKQV